MLAAAFVLLRTITRVFNIFRAEILESFILDV